MYAAAYLGQQLSAQGSHQHNTAAGGYENEEIKKAVCHPVTENLQEAGVYCRGGEGVTRPET